MSNKKNFHHLHEQLEILSNLLKDDDLNGIERELASLSFEQLSHILTSSPSKARHIYWSLIQPELYGDILDELDEDIKDELIQSMTPRSVAQAAENLEVDELGYILRSLPNKMTRQILEQMDSDNQRRAQQALAYEPDTAGSMMSKDVITIRGDLEVDVILRYLRLKGDIPESTDALYVLNEDNQLIGNLALTVLITSKPDALIKDIMQDKHDALYDTTAASDLASLFGRKDWISAPVIDNNNQLVGRITIDDVVDIIIEDADNSMLGFAGTDEKDPFTGTFKAVRSRSLWLGINVFAALLAASVSNLFEPLFQQMAVIAVLMTIVPSMGGVAGNQTVALVIRGLALGHIGRSNFKDLIIKEASIALLNGIMWAAIIGGLVFLWKSDLNLSLILSAAMLANLCVAGIAGVLIPLGLKKLNIDPALAGGMLLTTITDISGLLAFLSLAALLI